MRVLLCLTLTLVCCGSGWGLGTHTVHSPPLTLEVSDGRIIVLKASATWTDWPTRVYCQGRAAWIEPIPPCPVRLIVKCKSRYPTYWFASDGSYKRWIKVWDSSAMTRTPGQTYTLDGRVSAKGQFVLNPDD